MTNDRELLEQAAKSAGIEKHRDGVGFIHAHHPDWNPLTDDGDALRLAVKLEIDVDHILGEVVASRDKVKPEVDLTYEAYGDDPYAATRRAIVRAAAEIGRTM